MRSPNSQSAHSQETLRGAARVLFRGWFLSKCFQREFIIDSLGMCVTVCCGGERIALLIVIEHFRDEETHPTDTPSNLRGAQGD